MNTSFISEAHIYGVATGDVIEFELEGRETTALVLLAADESMIIDLCDETTPLVVRYDEIATFRKFTPDFAGLALAA